MSSLPTYVSHANTLSDEDATEICARFDVSLDSFRADLAQANQYAATRRTRADSRGHGMGLFNSAESLFWGYVYESERCNACESAEASRNEDRAYGSD